jgi:hypothetical protein
VREAAETRPKVRDALVRHQHALGRAGGAGGEDDRGDALAQRAGLGDRLRPHGAAFQPGTAEGRDVKRCAWAAAALDTPVVK